MISVIIPLYNKEASILRSMNSVLNQTYKDIELIVVDDGSTDNSYNIAQRCADTRLVLLQQTNAGPSAARNTGVKYAKGEWIVFLDADDELVDDALSLFHRMSLEHAEVDIFDCNKYLRRNGNLTLQKHPIEGYVDNPLKEFYYRNISPGCGHSMFKTSFVKKHPYDERIRRYEDCEILLRMLPNANVFSSSLPTEIHDLDLTAASSPRKDISEDFMGHLDINKGGFWYKMCVFRTFIEEREHYKEDTKRLYPHLYKRYDLLLFMKMLSLIERFRKV